MFFSEKTLINRAIKGNASAWESLVKKHEKGVFNTALRMTCNHDDAMDLTQDVFFDVYRKLSLFRQESSFATWVRKIAFSKTVDFLRRKKEATSLEVDSLVGGSDPHSDLVRSDQNRVILSFLNQLGPDQRLIIELKFFKGHTFEEIANTLKLSPNTVKTKFYSALKTKGTKLEASHVL